MVILFSRIALCCGMNWSEPRCKIEGCDEQGYVSIAEKLVDLNIPGEKEPLPIWAIFNSSSQTASPYVGMGWRIPFLECNMVQLSENEFMLLQPSGWKRLFRRSAKGSDVLDGGGGWKGQLSPDHATLWADCGWRIDLHKGKIVQMKTAHGQTITYNYTNGRISSVVCGMKTLVAIDSAEEFDHTLGIIINGKHYSIAKSDQPRIQRVAGVNVIAGDDPTFNQLTGLEKQTRVFTYNVDQHTRPMLTIANAAKQDTTVLWDPGTRLITDYGEWKYDIKPSETLISNSAIGRKNLAGQSEFYHYDNANAREIVMDLTGTESITKMFSSGAIAGKVREIQSTRQGQVVMHYKAYYDEKGHLVREDRDIPELEIKDNALEVTAKFAGILKRILQPYSAKDSIEFSRDEAVLGNIESGISLLNWLGKNRIALRYLDESAIKDLQISDGGQRSIQIIAKPPNESHSFLLQSRADPLAPGMNTILLEEMDKAGHVSGKYYFNITSKQLSFQRCFGTCDGRVFFGKRQVFNLAIPLK